MCAVGLDIFNLRVKGRADDPPCGMSNSLAMGSVTVNGGIPKYAASMINMLTLLIDVIVRLCVPEI